LELSADALCDELAKIPVNHIADPQDRDVVARLDDLAQSGAGDLSVDAQAHKV
jgi:hypothetical protein